MKKLIGTFFICLAIMQIGFSQAENYKAFEWDIIRLGYVIPGGDGVKGGLSIGSEPRFNITDNISAGIRWELALFGSELESEDFEIGAAASYALIGDYYFSNTSNFRPFAGVGIGSFTGASVKVGDEEVDAGSSIGAVIRAGYEVSHLRLSAEYNLPFDDAKASSYFGINLGITLFGGYKK